MIHPSSLRKARTMKGLSQRELARLSGISQATISMIENGIVRPRFETMEKLSFVLERKGRVIGDVMTTRVISVKPHDSVRRAKNLMKKHAISQLPVISDRVIGTVREKDLMKDGRLVKDVMSHPLPQMDISTPVETAKEVLKIENAILVIKQGRVCGIVTKSDVI